MEKGGIPNEELRLVIDELFEWSDAIAHEALFRILQAIRESEE